MLTAYPMQRMTLKQNERLVQVILESQRIWSVKHIDGSDLLVEYRCSNQRDVMVVIDRDGELPTLTITRWPQPVMIGHDGEPISFID